MHNRPLQLDKYERTNKRTENDIYRAVSLAKMLISKLYSLIPCLSVLYSHFINCAII